ncbi:PorP/SprF family type IX secretion system membrane protein [Salegentibacter salegens]|uniref:Type IX secretion system membrane protein, PorP/SprF family n=1 Tax=Salegentibacter salegens TaxID=143223 RepID=A0A1M7MY79_9FLAO|nr:type IX secretion system membrane protein PorP/SprF [Salegentibacter salegens]PRX52440.1 type IX secretion system PorP/SprF family membrane protein [Salegentibacter salegens]SHM96026.1 type IX secretion system membrane protein, PorP/SprF family [Salegentibacter salegens]
MGIRILFIKCFKARQISQAVKCIFIIFFGFLSGASAKAQEVIPIYSDYLTDNLFLIHPSMAGAANRNQIRLTARQQWFDVDNAPSLQTLAVNGRLGDKLGVGGIVFNDKNGNFSKIGTYGTVAYHLLFSRSELDLNQLSFGISAGIVQHRLDQSGFTEFDPNVNASNESDFFGNMDIGMSYYYLDFYAHLAAKNIISIKRELFYSDAVPSNQRKYLFSTGYVFDNNNEWSYEPSILYQLREATNEMNIDLNMKVYRNVDFGQVWGGLSYRNSFEGTEYTTEGNEVESQQLRYITPFVGLDYKNFMFGYTFSYQFNSVVLSNNGFHQITIGYDFGKSRGRWDCKCPAIN